MIQPKTTKPLKIYLVNLTHTHVALAHGTFPLGIAYVASALKDYFKDQIQLELFKYLAFIVLCPVIDISRDIFSVIAWCWSGLSHPVISVCARYLHGEDGVLYEVSVNEDHIGD